MKEFSRPGRDAGLTLINISALILRPSRARLMGGDFPVAALRFATG
ncbi:MAG TPA: hypothetical protein VI479_17130 [Blastocatellia bacterium]